MNQDREKNAVVCDCDMIHPQIVERVRSKMLEDAKLFELADFLAVFGDSTRVRILWALEEGELCVCDLAVLLNMTKSAISHQLRSLRQVKLVKYRREGKNVYYSLDDHHIKGILDLALEHVDEDKS